MNKGTTQDSIIFDVEVRIELPPSWADMDSNSAINAALKKLREQTGIEPVHYRAKVYWSNNYFSVKFHWYNMPKDLDEKMEEMTKRKVDMLFDMDPDSDENGDPDINGWGSASTRSL